MNSEDVIKVPKDMFQRMATALIGVEKILKQREENKSEWIGEEEALSLLGCSKRQLYRLKGEKIRYKAIGKRHQYSLKSIEKYNEQMSS